VAEFVFQNSRHGASGFRAQVKTIPVNGDAHEIVKQRFVGGACHRCARALLKPLQADAVNERARLRAPLDETTHTEEKTVTREG
jgi:hypothetical protein